MPHLPPPVLATIAVPVAMVVAGLTLAILGLVLLTGGGRRRAATDPDPADPRTADPRTADPRTAGADTPPPTPAPRPTTTDQAVAVTSAPDATTSPGAAAGGDEDGLCDWSAHLEGDDGQRTPLREPVGRACCTYVLRVRDLDAVPDEVDSTRETLTWSGAHTRLGPDGAVTPLYWDVVTRRAASTGGGATTALTLSRAPAPPVRTSPWRPAQREDQPPGVAIRDPARLWRQHLDELRAAQARPAPVDGTTVARLEHHRRVEVHVSVRRGCRAAPRAATVEGSCRARLDGSATSATARLEVALLGSWMAVDGTDVVAVSPSAPPLGLRSWAVTAPGTGRGVSASIDPDAATSRSEWAGDLHTTTDPDHVTVVVGSEAVLEVGTPIDPADAATTRVEAETAAEVHVRLAPTDEADVAACSRCVPVIEVHLGQGDDPSGAQSTAPTSLAHLRLDGRALPLDPPVPGGDARAWTIAGRRPPEGPERVVPRVRW